MSCHATGATSLCVSGENRCSGKSAKEKTIDCRYGVREPTQLTIDALLLLNNLYRNCGRLLAERLIVKQDVLAIQVILEDLADRIHVLLISIRRRIALDDSQQGYNSKHRQSE